MDNAPVANPEHLREQKEELQPNLGDADLRDRDLHGADFPAINLWHAYLSRTNPGKTDLRASYLNRATLSGSESGCHQPAPAYDRLAERRFEFSPLCGQAARQSGRQGNLFQRGQ